MKDPAQVEVYAPFVVFQCEEDVSVLVKRRTHRHTATVIRYWFERLDRGCQLQYLGLRARIT